MLLIIICFLFQGISKTLFIQGQTQGEEELDFMLKKELNLGLLRIYLFLMKRSLNRFVYRLNLTTKKRTSLANSSQQMESFLEPLEELLVNVGITDTPLCTDSNIDLLKLISLPSIKKFFEISCHGYLKLISRTTRLSSINFKLID